MATNFINKYIQVFQNYNEFSEHSADYVRGEDHIAFLIEENEVIYWLYLEQVWRPLNVRTTTTGQLEDGRTKVAVRLEYVEGGQKYISVPNIPDPERITSMSHFLEDYPDIKEVNVSGTVNLTDLSYAFANSNIKDFSMLDTSNVTNIVGIIDNVNNKDLDITIKYKTSYNKKQNIDFNNITLNKLELIQLLVFESRINICDSNINKLILNNQRIALYGTKGSNIINKIESNSHVIISSTNGNSKGNKISNIVTNRINICPSGLVDDNILNIIFNDLIIEDNSFYSHYWKNKIICLPNNNECTILFNFDFNKIYSFDFGYGIDYSLLSNTNLAVRDNCIIGNFIFTIPIVNDKFINKYNNAKRISIFQYKTTFTEVADVNISNEVDSNLLYVNWSDANDKIKNASIIINNIIDTRYIHGTYKNLIIDNSSFDLNENNCPKIFGTEYRELYIENGYISGKYCFEDNGNFGYLKTLSCYKNILIYNTNDIIIANNNINDNNIKVNYKNYINLHIDHFNKIEPIQIKNLFDDNIIRICFLSNGTLWDCNKRIEYLDNYKIELYDNNGVDSAITPIIEYLKKEDTVYIKTDCNFQYSYSFNSNTNRRYMFSPNSGYEKDYFDNIETLYMYCDDDAYVSNLIIHLRYIYSSTENINDYGNFIKVKNILGIINLYINGEETNADTDTSYIHIDINKTKVINNASITGYNNLDNETTINLITKLIDNTSSLSKVIYMYRSQANIIGEENIAAAVAKNYEIAIIEN